MYYILFSWVHKHNFKKKYSVCEILVQNPFFIHSTLDSIVHWDLHKEFFFNVTFLMVYNVTKHIWLIINCFLVFEYSLIILKKRWIWLEILSVLDRCQAKNECVLMYCFFFYKTRSLDILLVCVVRHMFGKLEVLFGSLDSYGRFLCGQYAFC